MYDVVTQEIVGPYGKRFDWSVKVKMMGRPPPQSAQILVNELQLPMTNMEFLDKAKAGFARHFPTANLMPGLNKASERVVCCVTVTDRQADRQILTDRQTQVPPSTV